MRHLTAVIFFVTIAMSVFGQVKLLKDITDNENAPNEGSIPSSPCEFKGQVYFRAFDWVNGYELYRTDGTKEGTALFKDLNPGSGNSTPSYMTVAGDKMFFSASNAPWVTDG